MISTRSPRTWAAAVLAFSFGLRLLLSLTANGFSGIDAGAYILNAFELMGHAVPHIDVARPPLAPGWPLVAFIHLFGTVHGYNAYAAVASMVLPIAGAWVGFRLFSPRKALALTVILAFDPFGLGMMVTGPLPLMGIALIILASYGLWNIATIEALSKRTAALVIICIGLLPFVNQTSAGLACIVLPFQWMLLPNKKRLLGVLSIAFVVALTALPWYVDVSPTSSHLTYPGPIIIFHNVWEHQLWLGLAGVVLAWRATRDKRFKTAETWLRMSVYLLAFLALFQMFQSFNEVIMNLFFRATYLMAPFAWFVLVWLARIRVPSQRTLAVGALAIVALTVWQVRYQQELSGYGTRELLAVANDVPADNGSIVTNTQATAFVIAGATGHNVLWTHYIQPPPGLAEEDAQARCVLGWVEGCTLPSGVRYVLVDTRLPLNPAGFAPATLRNYGAPEQRPWHLLSGLPWLTLMAQDGPVQLYEVKNDAIAANHS